LAVALAILVGLVGLVGPARAADPLPVTTSGGVVAADHAAASAAGARVLAAGGNAVDAAAATALALGVVNPTSSGVGGGGFALVYLARDGIVRAIDFREVAPAELVPALFVDAAGAPIPGRSTRGGLAVGVPGELAGLEHLVHRWGARSWRRAVTPAIALARDGFVASAFLARAAGLVAARLPDEPAFAPLRALLAPVAEGARVDRAALARTLAAVAEGGAAAFYAGAIADDVVATVRAAGGVMTAADLAAYRVIEREPLWGAWRGHRIATMPLPSSGGLVLLEALALLDATGTDPAALGAGSPALLHLVAEVLKHAFADRARWLGDTAAAAASAAAMLDPARLAAIARRIDPDRTQPHASYGAGAAPGRPDDGGTSHVCVVDAAGNAVALTTTVNGYFGSGLVTAGGVVLNNQIDDFTVVRGTPNAFGLVQSEENLVGGGKRPLSSMTPVLVFDASGAVVGCAGGSGGPRIISAVFQALIHVFALGQDAARAVAAPRIHHQWTPDAIVAEAELGAAALAGLQRRGHAVRSAGLGEVAVVQLIRVRPDGVREAASDPRKGGAPVAEPVR
jgi:gamma-glutamyltranspeptidase/glutathione hydrolase